MHALIEKRIENLIARAESEGDYIGWYEDWTEGGAPEGGIYVSESWDSDYGWGRRNRVKVRPNTLEILQKLLEEHANAYVTWTDHTVGCGSCDKLIDTDNYYRRTFHMWDGDVSCRECVVENEAADYIDWQSENGTQIEFYEIDPEEYDWTRCESDRYSEASRYDESVERAKRVKNGYRTVIDSDGYLWIKRN